MSEENKSTGAPIWGPMFQEKLFDPHDAPEHTRWIPFNAEARELGACIEACKQILELRPLLLVMPSRRTYAMLTTPVLSLVEHAVALHKFLGKLNHQHWPEHDLQNFTGTARKLRKQNDGPLPRLRNKLGAHHDVDALHPSSEVPHATAGLVLLPLGNALLYLILALNHEATFAYYRRPDLSRPQEIQVIVEYPLATTLVLDPDGLPVAAVEFRMATDPRHESSGIVKAAIELYNEAARKTESDVPLIAFRDVSDRPSKLDDESVRLRML
jgi:hypothetical protein